MTLNRADRVVLILLVLVVVLEVVILTAVLP